MLHPPIPLEEIGRRGEELYESSIRELVDTPPNKGRVIVIDIDSGEYEIDTDHLAAVNRARARNPNALLYATRVGYPALGRIGRWPGAART